MVICAVGVGAFWAVVQACECDGVVGWTGLGFVVLVRFGL